VRAGLNEAAVGFTSVGPAKDVPPADGGAKVFPRAKIPAVAPTAGLNAPRPANSTEVATVAPPGTRELDGTKLLFVT
jgi:hypothetical protein